MLKLFFKKKVKPTATSEIAERERALKDARYRAWIQGQNETSETRYASDMLTAIRYNVLFARQPYL